MNFSDVEFCAQPMGWVWVVLGIGKVMGVLSLAFIELSLVQVGLNDAEVVNCLREYSRERESRDSAEQSKPYAKFRLDFGLGMGCAIHKDQS